MNYILSILIINFYIPIVFSQEVPFRANENFEIFSSFLLVNEKPEENADWTAGPKKQYNPTPVMHLRLTIKITNVKETENIVKAISNNNVVWYKKKLKEGLEFTLDFGNFEKVKKKEIPYLFTIFILDKKKEKTNKIKVEVLESGAVFVNEKPHGKK